MYIAKDPQPFYGAALFITIKAAVKLQTLSIQPVNLCHFGKFLKPITALMI